MGAHKKPFYRIVVGRTRLEMENSSEEIGYYNSYDRA